ncbi:MAG TPA: GNAT family N-acetyltransferase [Stellaceae bacterium]|nr:GNAT family N-acetyltransferase [Stellaceae bacterium]
MSAVRSARLEDAKAIARIEVDTWRSTYAGLLPDRVLLNMSERRQAASWASFLRHRPEDVWVAQRAGGVIGFGNCGTQRDNTIRFAGEIYTLYVATDHQGQGLGRGLLLALFQRLVDTGHGSALIWVVRANPARFFYERMGGQQIMHRPIPVGGQPIEAIAYGWKDLSAALARTAKSGDGMTGDSPLH